MGSTCGDGIKLFHLGHQMAIVAVMPDSYSSRDRPLPLLQHYVGRRITASFYSPPVMQMLPPSQFKSNMLYGIGTSRVKDAGFLGF